MAATTTATTTETTGPTAPASGLSHAWTRASRRRSTILPTRRSSGVSSGRRTRSPGTRKLPRNVTLLAWPSGQRLPPRDRPAPKLDTWLARLVSPANIQATCRRLSAAHTQPRDGADAGLRAAQLALADCQRKLARHRAALEAGGDPEVINQWIAETIQQQRHAQHTLDQLRAASASQQQQVDPGLVRALLEELGGLAAGLDLADPQQRAVFHQEMGISGLYQPADRIVLITAEPDMRRRTVRARGATPTFGIPTADRDAGAVSNGDSGRHLRHRAAGARCQASHARCHPSLRRSSTRL